MDFCAASAANRRSQERLRGAYLTVFHISLFSCCSGNIVAESTRIHKRNYEAVL